MSQARKGTAGCGNRDAGTPGGKVGSKS